MDGVLVDSADAHRASWKALGEKLGRPISDEEFANTFGRSSRDIIRILFGEDTPPEQIAKWDEEKEALYRDLIRDRVPLMPGARALVDALFAAKVKLAIGSSGPRANIEMILDALEANTPPKFAAIVSGFDVTRGKPDPQVFLLAAEKLGLAPKACAVIEDAPAGIEAARRAGMRAVALASSHPREALSSADHIVDALDELHVDLAGL